jgi:predicted ATPase
LDAIEGVCGHDLPTDVFELLASLVDKSLLQQQELPRGEPRFRMLETLHEYAREQLAASGEAPALAERQATYFVELAERAEPELRQAQQQDWFRRLGADHDNLRAALNWSLDCETDGADEENAQHARTTLGARLAGALGHFWFAGGYHAEGRA